MPMADWIHKYPRVQALLQGEEDPLEYAPDGEEVDVEEVTSMRGINTLIWESQTTITVAECGRLAHEQGIAPDGEDEPPPWCIDAPVWEHYRTVSLDEAALEQMRHWDRAEAAMLKHCLMVCREQSATNVTEE